MALNSKHCPKWCNLARFALVLSLAVLMPPFGVSLRAEEASEESTAASPRSQSTDPVVSVQDRPIYEPTNAFAASPQGEQAGQQTAAKELQTLEHFLSLSDEQLDKIESVIRRIREMNVEQRQELLEKIQSFRALSPETRGKITSVLPGSGLTQEERESWRKMMHSLADNERAKVISRLTAIEDPQQRKACRRQILEEWLLEQDASE